MNFCDKPIIAYSLEVAKNSELFDKIHVSTEDPYIKEVVESLGYEVDFLRDPSLSDDYTGLVPVLDWVIEQYHQRGEHYSEICMILPTAPLINTQDIIEGDRLFNQPEFKS